MQMRLGGTKRVSKDRILYHQSFSVGETYHPGAAANSPHLLSDCLNSMAVSPRGRSFQAHFTSSDGWRRNYQGSFALFWSRTALKGHLCSRWFWGLVRQSRLHSKVASPLLSSDSFPSLPRWLVLMMLLYHHLLLWTLPQSLLSGKQNLSCVLTVGGNLIKIRTV